MAKVETLLSSKSRGAVVRFSHCELRLLELGSHPATLNKARKAIMRYSNIECSAEVALTLRENLIKAIKETPLLGTLSMPTLVKYSGLSPAAIREKMVFDHLGPFVDRYLATNPRHISVVSCRNLKPVLEGMGVENVTVYQIPSEQKFRGLDSAYERSVVHVPVFPDAIDAIRKSLVVHEEGEVFLIGAGLFAKYLCIEIMNKGGCALDVGSYLDNLVGLQTRGPTKGRARRVYSRA
jgi:hypothetical protein